MRAFLLLLVFLAACEPDPRDPMEPSPDGGSADAAPDAAPVGAPDADVCAPYDSAGFPQFPCIVPRDSLWSVHAVANACPGVTPRLVRMAFGMSADYSYVAHLSFDNGFNVDAAWGPVDESHLWTGEQRASSEFASHQFYTSAIVWSKAGDTLQATATFTGDSIASCPMTLLAVKE